MNKRELLTLTVSALISLSIFAQKSELKTAEKAVKKKEYSSALAAISQAESLIGAADAKAQAKYYYLKGISLYEDGAGTDVDAVITAFNSLIKVEEESGSDKYTSEVEGINAAILEKVYSESSAAYELGQQNEDVAKYKEAAIGYEKMGILSPKDTVYLYNSAVVFAVAGEYEKSNEMYKNLLDNKYTGVETLYTATSIVDGTTRAYNSSKDMANEVKLKISENPKTEVLESKYIPMIKGIASNYIALENNEKALEFLAKAREDNPLDYNLIIEEGNVYYKMGNDAKFKEKLEEAIEINPTNSQLYYNVGIMSMNMDDDEGAERNFKKAIELKTDFSDAYNALGNLYLKELGPIQVEMNANGSDFKKYDEIKETKFLPVLREAFPYIERAYELNNSDAVKNQLNSIYENLGMEKRIK
jgi:tetratricopeptide (TPR) repeat protein